MKNPDQVKRRILANIRLAPSPEWVEGYCWIWRGSTSGNGRGGGYGRIKVNGYTRAVHIIAFRLFKGKIRPGMQIDHECTNRLCCNPKHLQQVTASKNQKLKHKRLRVKT